MTTTKARKIGNKEMERPAPVSLHPLSTEQALGALLRTPAASTTKAAPPKKRPSRKRRK